MLPKEKAQSQCSDHSEKWWLHPFDVIHNDNDLNKLVELIKGLASESRVVMEYTGTYFEPIAQFLHNNGIFVSVINALLVHDYGGNSLRKVKTDKKDALKLVSYALDRWTELEEYIPADEQCKTLKMLNRQYNQSNKIQTMIKNNLISLTDSTFPGINKLFTSPERQSDGHEKWVDFLNAFHHINDSVELLITQAVTQLNTILETVSYIRKEMDRIASSLPEYETVMAMYGVGKVYEPQLMAEISDTHRFRNRRAITAFLQDLTLRRINRDSLMLIHSTFPSVALQHSERFFFRLPRFLF